jgi:isorenieratene synthase
MNAPFFRRPALRDGAAVLSGPDWKQANPRWMERALARTQARPSGGWFVIGASRSIGPGPARHVIAARDVVVWRAGGRVHAAPDACPHMGASLADGCVREGRLVCPWHGLELDGPHGRWRPFSVHDDGVLVWVRMPAQGQDVSLAPILPERPPSAVDSVMRMDARCEPEDVVANRLDPWHGVHFHPASFSRLRVIDLGEDEVTVRVSYKVWPAFEVEVDARFHSPEPRTIAMTIVDGEGTGSVVETHATPLGPGRTAVIEATLATSDRPGFWLARRGAWFLRPLIRRAARKLWVDDVAYAERRYALRTAAVER